MQNQISRRLFLKNTALASAGVAVAGTAWGSTSNNKELFKLSVAEWSVNPTHFLVMREKMAWEKFMQLLKNDFGAIEKAAPMKNIDFPKFIRKVGCQGAEYVNTCMYDKAQNTKYLNELNNVCRGEGITNVLIMVDAEGMVGAPEKKIGCNPGESQEMDRCCGSAGCHSVRVNAGSQGSYEEQQKLAADGLHLLCEYGDKNGINILVENHGGFSSNGKWLSKVMEMVNHRRIGTLPDFGNFRTSYEPEEW